MIRDYQSALAQQASEILKALHIVYLTMEPRVGKTIIAFETCKLMDYHNVLFLTKKKAIASIVTDYKREGYEFDLRVINYEQAGKLNPDYDCVIVDEAHSLGAYPKPSLRTVQITRLVGKAALILASGTPTPESYSQIYHQLGVSDYSPFAEYPKFYSWAKDYVKVTQKIIQGFRINDYSGADKNKIMAIIEPYLLSYTRSDAGFERKEIIEEIKYVDMGNKIKTLMKLVLDNRYYKFANGSEIVCDTAAKLQQKIHQICSGTVKDEDGNMILLDRSKVQYIQEHYAGRKIAIFYKFNAEGELLKQSFSNITDSPEVFNASSDRIFLSQIQSGSMGLNLSSADILIFFNIDFSSVQYQQAKDRIIDMNRTQPAVVHWLFSVGGIEDKVYKIVKDKQKKYTTYYFKRDFLKDTA